MGIKIVSENRKARADFTILETMEAGLQLKGSEVKSLRAGSCQLRDSYVMIRKGEAFWEHGHISAYHAGGHNNHEPLRKRKLLLHKSELLKLDSQIREKGLSCIPLKVYFKDGRAKIEIALAKGKKKYDKRESIKKRDVARELSSRMKKGRG